MEASRLPNIIIFNPDSWRGKDVSCLGNLLIQTPHTDQLAEEGVAFSNCFVQNTFGTPSRCSFMTGRYPHVRGHRTTHHVLNPEEPFILKQLMDQGYYVWWGGKNDVVRKDEETNVCSLRYHPQKDNVNEAKPPATGPEDRLFYSHYRGKLADHRIVNHDDALIDGAIEFIRSKPQEPFCICLTLDNPHVPFQVEEPYYSMYDRSMLPPIIPEPEQGNKSRHLSLIRERMGLDVLTEDDFKEILAVYYGMITKIDDGLGKLVEALKESDHWHDSAVFVFSDHGEYAGDYGMVEKTQNSFEDDLTKVPLLIKYPSWISIPERDRPLEALVELIDFYATVAELAKLPQRHTHFGRSLVPLSMGETVQHRDQVFCEGGGLVTEKHTHEQVPEQNTVYWPRLSVQNDDKEAQGKGIMVRTIDWKYVKRLYENDELYDLRNDPEELHNLTGNPDYENVRRQMLTRIARWYLETVDAVPYEPVMAKLEGKV